MNVFKYNIKIDFVKRIVRQNGLLNYIYFWDFFKVKDNLRYIENLFNEVILISIFVLGNI